MTATPNFRSYNTWHAAPQRDLTTDSLVDLEGEILEVCEDECDQGVVYVAGRVLNRGYEAVDTEFRLLCSSRRRRGVD